MVIVETTRREISFVLPLPPSINASYATVHGRRVASRALRTFKRDVRYHLHEQGIVAESWKDAQAVGYEATFYFRTRASDVDNYIKVLQDSLSAALGWNDNRVYEAHLYKRIDKERPRVEVRLYEVVEQQ